jgi:hypothetical protein
LSTIGDKVDAETLLVGSDIRIGVEELDIKLGASDAARIKVLKYENDVLYQIGASTANQTRTK